MDIKYKYYIYLSLKQWRFNPRVAKLFKMAATQTRNNYRKKKVKAERERENKRKKENEELESEGEGKVIRDY